MKFFGAQLNLFDCLNHLNVLELLLELGLALYYLSAINYGSAPMSSESLIENKIIGNELIWHNLVNDYLTSSISHAYIFAGTKGIGKASLAKNFIKLILSADEILSERIEENNFLDLMIITKQDKNEIGVESVRKITEFLSYTPNECNYKFVIIDSADDLNKNASNALLKILEEPSKNTFLFLISHAPSKLLGTIRSRARIIKFKPLNQHDLKLVADLGELPGFEDFIAGSVGRAIANNRINNIAVFDQLLDLIYNKDVSNFNNFCLSYLKDQEAFQIIVEMLHFIYLQILRCKSNIEPIDERIKKISFNFTFDAITQNYDNFCVLIRQNEIFNLDKKQVLFQIIHSL